MTLVLNSAPKLVVVAGSKAIQSNPEPKIELARVIGARIVQERSWMLFNGGALSIDLGDTPTAIDYFAAKGAEEYLLSKGCFPEDHILTLHPKTSTHSLHSIGRVEVSPRRTPVLRRFDLVSRADAIITIEGLGGLRTMTELALSLGKPIIPIPSTGGVSQEAWNLYEDEILRRFQIAKDSTAHKMLAGPLDSVERIADVVIQLVRKALSPNCFVAMPYGGEFDHLYEEAIAPAVFSAGFFPLRADEILSAEDVMTDIDEAIRNSQLMLADITGNNPNVMYEIGYAHALGKKVLLMCQRSDDKGFISKLPFDIHMIRILGYSMDNLDDCRERIKATLSRYSL